MGDIWTWERVPYNTPGTTCASCWDRGIMTLHSPEGDQHKAWENLWSIDPDWWPVGAPDRWRSW